ncbi:MAG: lamin tail domain-containing protein [Chloroflexi bacterium]|nr:lamin tail domain-containing protein [Chloroflexota bacterium]
MITEVYPNVAADGTSLESYEWIEIHNLERHPVNLDGWTIEDAQAIAPLPAFELQGGESVLVVGGGGGGWGGGGRGRRKRD